MIALYFHCTDGIETLMDDRGHVFTGLGSGSVRGMALARIRELAEASVDTRTGPAGAARSRMPMAMSS